MPEGNPRQGHVAIAAPDGRPTTPNYSRRARMLRIKQANSLNFSTVPSTSPTPASVMMPLCRFFMKFRGPKAHTNRLRNHLIAEFRDFVACPQIEFRDFVACWYGPSARET